MPDGPQSLELSRPLLLTRVGAAPHVAQIKAAPGECERVAARLRIRAVTSIEARLTLRRLPANIIEAEGELRAVVTQDCVVSLDPFESAIDEVFVVRFVPEDTLGDALDPDTIDEIGYTGDHIDLGEAAVEQLALALDPFPRKPGVVLPPGVSRGDAPPEKDAVIHPFEALRERRQT